ncbi:MAG: 2-isopropylmalate synthase [Candidatus Altiarchaeales archaeon]|nr:2-isopropylmalate synthase [Candidatus Altiarchaeales archaeon]
MNQFWYDKQVEPKVKPERIEVFDTTLRDGEQTPGVNLTVEDKKAIASALSKLGVKYIEAGFPVSSDGEFQSVKEIAEMGVKSKVVGLARCVEKDMDAALDAGVDLVHIFIGTSAIHRKYKLKMTKKEVMERAGECIQYVRDHGGRVHFSPEDACRTEKEYLAEVCRMADEMKVEHINIPDTVGVMTPAAMGWVIGELKKEVKCDLAVHCHNDFGMAAANTISAIVSGATIPHVTVNGLGERAGNADLEQTVMACELIHGIKTGVKKKRIWETSRLVERLSGIKVMPNFPIVGGNAFAHESGVHVHGVLAKASTYEAIDPETVGAKRRMVLGKLVGKAGVKDKLSAMGVKVTDKQAADITKKVKDLADKGKKVTEEDLAAIAEDMIGKAGKKGRIVELEDMSLHLEYGKNPTASVDLKVRGRDKYAKEEGVGPVDATLNAIRSAIGDKDIQLDEYHLDAITGGSDALADVSIRVSKNGQSTMARGVHEDVVMASVIAFINGANRIMKK